MERVERVIDDKMTTTEKPNFAVVWTAKLAPACAGALTERFLTNDAATYVGSVFGVGAADVRSALLFVAIIALTDPILIFRILRDAIYKIRVFCHDACVLLKDGMNKPIEEDKE